MIINEPFSHLSPANMNFELMPEGNYNEAILSGLNERQREGALRTEGPLLVVAGAGSGKTKMLTARIAHLIQNRGVRPSEILAVTFTNKAAGEMRARVAKTLGFDPDQWSQPQPFWIDPMLSQQPLIGTFHAVCTKILRRELSSLPYTSQFQILDDSDQLSMVKDCFKKLDLSDKTFSPKSFQYSINKAKCSCFEPQDLAQEAFDYYTKNLVKVYELYQQELFKSNSIDFGEIITLTYKLLNSNPDVLERYQNLFRYIHVDEYQDTNRAQYLVITLLAQKFRNLCVVGDEDQSIYRWRGADIRNILDFEKDYPDTHIVKLEQNYRSTKNIIKASSHVISHNSSRKVKTLWTENPEGDPIYRIQLADDLQEAEFVARSIQQACTQKFTYKDVAIFYRTNAQSRLLEDVLRREKISYVIIGGLKFYDRKEVKDAIAFLRVIANDNDSLGFRRIINVPQRSIGKTTIEKIEALQMERGSTFSLAAKEAVATGRLTGNTAKKVTEFFTLISDLRTIAETLPLSEFYTEVLTRTGYIEALRVEATEESLARIENLQELSSVIADFEESISNEQVPAVKLLSLFLEDIALVTDRTAAEEQQSLTGSVSLMTLHTSKGLEFPVVYMVGLEDGLFPSLRGQDGDDFSNDDLEEERRLCYVGMTRAEQVLFMTSAACRRVYGNIMYYEPSRFFDEIPPNLTQLHDFSRTHSRHRDAAPFERSHNQGSRGNISSNSVPARSSGFSTDSSVDQSPSYSSGLVGKKVRHQSYGIGIIRASEGIGTNQKVTIEFQKNGTKKFMLRFLEVEYLEDV